MKNNIIILLIMAGVSLLSACSNYGDVTDLIDDDNVFTETEKEVDISVVGLWIGESKNKNGVPCVEQFRFCDDGTFEYVSYGMFRGLIEYSKENGNYTVKDNEVIRTKGSTTFSPIKIEQSESEYYFLYGETKIILVEPNFEPKEERSLTQTRYNETLNTSLIISEGGNMTIKDYMNNISMYGTYTSDNYELSFTLTRLNNTWRKDLGSSAKKHDFTTPYCITADGSMWIVYKKASCLFKPEEQ